MEWTDGQPRWKKKITAVLRNFLLSLFKQVSHLCAEIVTAFDSSSSFIYCCGVIPSFLWQQCKKIQSSSCAKMYSRIQLKLMKVQQTALVKFSVHSLKLRYIKHKITLWCYYSSKDQRGKIGGFTLKTVTLEMTGFIWVTQTAEHLHYHRLNFKARKTLRCCYIWDLKPHSFVISSVALHYGKCRIFKLAAFYGLQIQLQLLIEVLYRRQLDLFQCLEDVSPSHLRGFFSSN